MGCIKSTSLVCYINNRRSHTFPATLLLCCMLLLAESDTWSEACWVGIFQHCYYSEYNGWRPATRSISSSASSLPTSVRASQRMKKLWHRYSSDGPTCSSIYCTYKPFSIGVGVAVRGPGGVSQPEKHLSCRRRCDQTNQQRLENMIPLGEECEYWGTLQAWCALSALCRKKVRWGSLLLGPTAGEGWFKKSFRCLGA